jgi:hypothetical protein
MNDNNVTGPPPFFIQISLSINIPSTTFGQGSCAAQGLIIQLARDFPTTTPTTPGYDVAWVLSPLRASGSYYAWLDLRTSGFTGHMLFNTYGSQSSIQMLEIT